MSTTLPFFRWLVEQPAFSDGRFSTTYLDDVLAARQGQPFAEPTAEDERRRGRGRGGCGVVWRSSRDHGQPTEDRGAWRRAARLDGLR